MNLLTGAGNGTLAYPDTVPPAEPLDDGTVRPCQAKETHGNLWKFY